MKAERVHGRSGHRQCKQSGFSLIEVLIALFIVALTIGVAAEVAGTSARNTGILREQTLARWVALNQIDLYKIAVLDGSTAASIGAEQGEEEMGGFQWRWERRVQASPGSAELLEIIVTVFQEDASLGDTPLISMRGYVAAD